ncbi:hypothetical protein YYC_04768 [Plasmodium yoelii 17X]|uniref:Uncharacterized protein n=1 Tax=Plasmodium yoelii 17X TaxID=1323249 RepID=V7PGT5_PLAYE|nr:hypothetical protein YYC_04768 [Plasmodium yoelii 17X]
MGKLHFMEKLLFFEKRNNIIFISINTFNEHSEELYLVSERSICLERNIIKFRINRILADVDNKFNLNDFYQSTLSLANQLNGYYDDNEEIIYIRNAINSYIKKHAENNILLDLNNVYKKTKKSKKELDSKRNGELAIQPIQDKIIIKKDENISVSEHEDFKQLENSENILETEDNFKDEYNEVTSCEKYKELKTNQDKKKWINQLLKRILFFIGACSMAKISEKLFIPFMILVGLISAEITKKWWKHVKFSLNL